MNLTDKPDPMRPLLICLTFFLPITLFAQSNPLNFKSYAIKLAVANDESLSLVTRVGEVGVTSSINADWRRADVEKQDILSATLDQANFFNRDTGFVSGWIKGKTGKNDIIYHTTNGGLNWQEIKLGQEGWVDDGINLADGQAWLSISKGGILYTKDYGLNWTGFNNPEPKQRFTSIFFNPKKQGIIGSLWNRIAYTDDNCSTWKFLPTPLDQKKYEKTNKESRPQFERVAIYKDYFLVSQEKLVFYSKKDTVNWVWLPDYKDFFTDPQNSTLFFKTNKGQYVRADDRFVATHHFDVPTGYYDAECKNGSLFIATSSHMIKIDASNQLSSVAFITTESSGAEPRTIGYTESGFIGTLGNKLFIQKEFDGKWDYQATLPVSLDKGNLSVLAKNLLLFDSVNDTLFYYNFSGELVKAEAKKTMIENFCKSGISKIIFNQGGRGCYHFQSDELVYSNLGEMFGGAMEVNHGRNKSAGMPDNDENIGTDEVLDFVKKIPSFYESPLNTDFEELNFSSQDFEQCKKDILKFQNPEKSKKKKSNENGFYFSQNNIDFQRLLSLVDSVKYIEQSLLNQYLMKLNTSWSTSSEWKKIVLINNKGEKLYINSTYSFANAFYFPWEITFNGYTVYTTDKEVGNFIERVYPNFLEKMSKVQVLHALVKYIY